MATAARLPSNEDLTAEVSKVLRGSDLEETSLKEVRAELERRFGLKPGGLDARKDLCKQLVAAEIAKIQEEQAAQEEEGAGQAAKESEANKKNSRVSTGGQKRARESEEGDGKKEKKVSNRAAEQALCMTKADFMRSAKSFKIEIGDRQLTVPPKEFSTGSCGFFSNGKVTMNVGSVPLTVQCSLNCTVIGSKQWK
eukprot:CAMPEP_0172663026 /NCGR_PEP_ID=MMETSP1074-20121228/5675_1 /TAXON_ID=2916 /ORGANISM="Ceratium fusus, Strain PA161109" /LENGTH=195 /DNA_ID=CAMNT_0013478969 /DNA_START=77 /DNA_END=664 /DNA_ORIENTATION=-